MAPSTATALVQEDGRLSISQIPVPAPGDHQVLVKVSHVAQNPTDVQSLDSNAFGDGAVLGCDFVGTVESVGALVSRFTTGAKIAGLVWGGEIKGLGGYSTYTLADEAICFPVPDGLSPEAAATVPLAACTAWLSLFSKTCLSIDRQAKSPQTVLVWGGSSSVGLYAIQLATLCGVKVITTCSPKHHELARSLGASHALDYRAPDIVAQIQNLEPNLAFAFDTIGNKQSSTMVSDAVTQDGGVMCTVRPGKQFTENVAKHVKVTDVLVWTAFLKEHRYGEFVWPASPDDHNLAKELFSILPTWLSDGKVKPNAVKVFAGGLDGVVDGFQEYRDGKISNYKIVYTL